MKGRFHFPARVVRHKILWTTPIPGHVRALMENPILVSNVAELAI